MVEKQTSRYSRPLGFVAALLVLPTAGGTVCTVCRGGEPITKPHQPILFETSSPIPIDNCAALDAVASFVPADTPNCEGIQLLGAVCGCPLDANACRLCQSLPNPNKKLGKESQLLLQHALGETWAVDINSTDITCELYDAFLSSHDGDDSWCETFDPVRRTCGCPLLQNASSPSNQTGLATQCSVCEVRFPNNSLSSNGLIPTQTCGDAVVAANSGMMNATQCSQLQHQINSHEAPCGGCVPESVPEQWCSLCPEGFRLRNQSSLLEASAVNFTLLRQLNGTVRTDVDTPTCGDVEDALRAISADSDACVELQSLDKACGGCEETMGSNRIREEGRCTLCPFSEPVPFPNQTIDVDLQFPVADCGTLDLAARMFNKDSPDCAKLRALAKLCGCSMPASSCSICPYSPMTHPKKKFQWFQGRIADEAFGQPFPSSLEVSCEMLDSALATQDDSSQQCFVLQLRGSACGCVHPITMAAAILRRVFSTLSLFGSLYILQRVLRDKSKYTATYHQLVLGISSFDLFNSLSHSFGPTPIPAYSGISGARGNMTTCRVAAFFVQLSITSAYFNLGLAVYFWLVICHNKTEDYCRRFRGRLYMVVLFVGLGQALGGIPFYTFGMNACHIFPPPVSKTWFPTIFFVIMPVALVMVGVTTFTVLVLLEVRRREKASVRYRAGQKKKYWTRRVFWKSVLYLFAFYPTYPVLLVALFVDITKNTAWLFLLVAALGPSQGFWNFVVYYAYHRQRSSEGRGIVTRRGSTSAEQVGHPQELRRSSGALQTNTSAPCRGFGDSTPESFREEMKSEDRIVDGDFVGVPKSMENTTNWCAASNLSPSFL